MTGEWHYIHHATGRRELYGWVLDPAEQNNLAAQPELQETIARLHAQLAQHVRASSRPWAAPHYLMALDHPGTSFLRALAFETPAAAESDPGPRVGMSQAFFPRDTSAPASQRVRSEEDLLRTLPYR
jgi:hypothetical protein